MNMSTSILALQEGIFMDGGRTGDDLSLGRMFACLLPDYLMCPCLTLLPGTLSIYIAYSQKSQKQCKKYSDFLHF
jgi:hypothetical protein